MNITETAQTVGCLQSAIVSMYAMYMNDIETTSRCHSVGRLCVIKENRHLRLSLLVK